MNLCHRFSSQLRKAASSVIAWLLCLLCLQFMVNLSIVVKDRATVVASFERLGRRAVLPSGGPVRRHPLIRNSGAT